MFCVTNAGGMLTANIPDVCKTPAPPAPPVPVPYPNMAAASLADPGSLCKKIMVSGGMAYNMGSKTTLTNGDEAGVVGGMASNKFIGEAEIVMASVKVRLEGKGAVRVNDQTSHNAKNTMGMVTAPSQTKVMMG